MVRPLLMFATALLISCGGTSTPAPQPQPAPAPAAAPVDLTLPMVTYKWDPQAGDKSVPANLGGPGFTGKGWQTRMTFHATGDPKALKGGSLTVDMPDWPATTRMAGKDWNTQFNYFVNEAAYLPLVGMDPVTLEYVPSIATHWWISPDKTTYRFRINPEARWSDGSEVTAQDVVATWKLRVDPTLLDPTANVVFQKYEEPKALSKYIVEVKVKKPSWQNFMFFATQSFFPASQIAMSGAQYLDKYQFSYTSVNGPYEVKPADIVTGKSITLTRRADWWGKDNPAFAGWGNIDKIKWVVVTNPELSFEKAKKGELSYFYVPKAQWWAEEIPPLENVKRGILRPLKIFNDEPVGTSGIAINMKRPPLDDVRVREALQYLYPTKRLIKNLYYNEYRPLESYWQGGMYQNHDNPPQEYDPLKAVKLLEEAGWTQTNADGYRVKDGKVLELTIQYASSLSERGLTIYQEELKDAGIKLDLQLLTPAAQWKNLTGKDYQLSETAWGALVFPNPESSWGSKYADIKNNNNVTGFADPEVDKLCDEYTKEYDIKKRAKMVQQIDGLVYKQHPYVLEYYAGFHRTLVENKFAMPKWGAQRFGDMYEQILIWWVDPKLEKQVEAAKKDDSLTVPVGPKEIHFWEAWDKAQEAQSDASASATEASADGAKSPAGDAKSPAGDAKSPVGAAHSSGGK